MTQDDLFTPDGQPAYPIDPSAKCSKAALARVDVKHMERLVEAIYSAEAGGYTADEVAHILIRAGQVVDELSVRPRVSELKRARVLIPTGERRKNAKGNTAAVMVHRMYWRGKI